MDLEGNVVFGAATIEKADVLRILKVLEFVGVPSLWVLTVQGLESC